MRFFIPNVSGEEKAEEIYKGIVQFAESNLGKVSDKRIFHISYHENKKDYDAEVGKICAVNGEQVIAILYSSNMNCYLVCTPNRGVKRDLPILIGYRETFVVQEFDT